MKYQINYFAEIIRKYLNSTTRCFSQFMNEITTITSSKCIFCILTKVLENPNIEATTNKPPHLRSP